MGSCLIDAEQNVTSYTYDGLNRQTTETITALVGATPTQLTRTNTYNNAGNLAEIIDRQGRVRRFSYDTLDRLRQEDWFTNTSDPSSDHRLTWDYDKLDRIVKQVDSGPSTILAITADDIVDTFEYDGLGRLTQQANFDPAASPGASGRPEIRHTYDYIFEHFPVSGWAERTRRTESVAKHPAMTDQGQSYFYFDSLGRLHDQHDFDANVAAGPAIERKELVYAYDAAGNLGSIYWNGNYSGSTPQTTINTGFQYDKANRVTSITHNLATDIVHAYDYDNASRVASFNTAGSGAATRGYGYDAAGQLTGATGSASESYTYDENGNRQLVGGQAIVTGLANRLVDDGTYTYEYDKEGNLYRRTLEANPLVWTEYLFNRNRLTRIIDKDHGTALLQILYTYDADGRRVQREVDTNTAAPVNEYFVYDGDELAMTFNHAGQLEHRYLHGPADMALVDEVFNAAGQSTDVLWLLADQQGTVRDIVNDTGTLRKHVDYDSFGKVTGEQTFGAAVDQLFYYTGQERDDVTGDQKHGQRWYRPSIGRWLSEDTIDDPNLYAYAENDPINYYDPTGKTQAGNPLAKLPAVAAAPKYSTPNDVAGYYRDRTAQSSLYDPLYQSSSYDFFGPTRQQLSNAELNPHGPPVSVQTIVSPIYGDIFRSPNAALKNFIQTTDSPLAAGAAQLVKPLANLVGTIAGGFVDAALPASDPRYIVTYRDGTRGLFIGEGPSTGVLAGQAALFAPPVFSGVSRPAGTLTLRAAPEPLTIAPSTSLSPGVQQGNLFNRLRRGKYEFDEIYVENPAGGKYRLDSYSPSTGEIVSRKGTQFAEVDVKTGLQYVQEAARKYSPGAKIADVPTSRGLAGQELRGSLYLEVPIQAKPIPQKVLDAAKKFDVKIRDVNGKVY